jgi:hypothetical protein
VTPTRLKYDYWTTYERPSHRTWLIIIGCGPRGHELSACVDAFHSYVVLHSMTMKSFMCGSAVISLRMPTMIVI